jgi:hypothetical protein
MQLLGMIDSTFEVPGIQNPNQVNPDSMSYEVRLVLKYVN